MVHRNLFLFHPVLRCGIRKPLVFVQPFCLELSLAAVQKALREGEAPVDSSKSVLQRCELVGIWDALARTSPCKLIARCQTPGIELGAVTDWLRERCSSSSGLLVDSFEDEGFRICSDALFELQRRRVMTRQGALVSEHARKKTKLGERRGVRSNLRTYVSYAPGAAK